jgi:DNA-binding SARP family transcriptional activator
VLQLRLLGPVELRRDDGSRVRVPGRQSAALLACLALADQFSVARKALAELIWAGRGTEHADGSLRQELVRLRRTIGEHVLPAAAPSQSVRLETAGIDIDVVRFRAAACAQGAGAEAVALYRGALLEDFPLRPRDPFGEWLAVRRRELQEAASAVLVRMLRGGEGSPALAERLLAIDPLCEEAYRFLIRHHAGRCDLARAQSWFDVCEKKLCAAGIPISLETRTLIEDAKAEIPRGSANAFQILHPDEAVETTQWLRAASVGSCVMQRPLGRRWPEIVDRPSVVVMPFRWSVGNPGPAGSPSRRHHH